MITDLIVETFTKTPRDTLITVMIISAVLTVVILIAFYKIVMSGYFYNRKYPIAARLDSLAKEGKSLDAKELEANLAKIDFSKSKDNQLKQFNENLSK